MDYLNRSSPGPQVFIFGFSRTPSIPKKHGVKTIVFFEQFDGPEAAIQREKTIKRWNRAWKINAIEENNPTWRDLYEDLLT